MPDIKTLVHPTDFSRRSDRAFELACAVARDRQARLIVLHVGDKDALVFGDQSTVPVESDPQAELQRRFRDFERRAGNVRIACVFREGEPASEIITLAREEKADLIVMGAQGRGGLTRLLMGSVASEVAAESPCPVVTVSDPPAS